MPQEPAGGQLLFSVAGVIQSFSAAPIHGTEPGRQPGIMVQHSEKRSHSRLSRRTGRGQLTLVEHALCPLDSRSSLVPNLVYDTCFSFTDKVRCRRQATVRVYGPHGLSAHDEFYLWGLLALTLAQDSPDPEFHATPHYCLRQLGILDQRTNRGGQQYLQFAKAVERLSLVRYQADSFFDPLRGEHRKVSFGFFSYNLPNDPASNRAWRISWDRVFFEMAAAVRGSFHFDLDLYRQLDPATRRLFLFLCKLFYRRTVTQSLELRHLAVDVLGFASSVASRDLKAKVARCITALAEREVVKTGATPPFRRASNGDWSVVLERGRYFQQRASDQARAITSPIDEQLQRIGFDDRAVRWLNRTISFAILREWSDITLAALEKHGRSFFRKNACAYFLDNVKAAAQGTRSPPDWWHELRKQELDFTPRRQKKQRKSPGQGASFPAPTGSLFDQVRDQVLQAFISAGQPADLASANSEKFAQEALRQGINGDFASALRKVIG